MNRDIERYVQEWVNGSTLLIPNRDGCECLALGSQDTAGAVLVTPQQAQGGSGLLAFVVSARAPFIGRLNGPLLVTPITGVEPLTAATSLRVDMLDLIVYPTVPNVMPSRACYILDAGALSLGNLKKVRVRGRSRILAQISSSASVVNTITAYVLGAGGLVAVDSRVVTGTQVVWQLTETVKGDGITLGGYTAVDYLGFQTAGTATSSSVNAWDD